jgi:regulator of sirC expression with transglutaminase-like and TPR domain
MSGVPPFAELAATRDPPLDLAALALAAEFRPIDARGALQTLERLGEEVAAAGARAPADQVAACARVLGDGHGFAGETEQYDHPDNSMLDLVLERRRGLPILLSVVYIEVGRRAHIPITGVGLPGHFVVGHAGSNPPLLLDPFNGGAAIEVGAVPLPWTSAHDIVMRMLNNLVGAYHRRGDLAAAIRAAELRLVIPAPEGVRDALRAETRALRARLN